MRVQRRALVLTTGIFAAASIARGQAPQPTAPPASTTQLAGQIELARLVDLASTRLGYTIEYDAQVLKGSVSLRTPQAVPDTELWELVNRLLASRGFTTVQLPGSGAFTTVRIDQAAPLARIEPDSGAGLAGFQTILIQPRFIGAKELAEGIRALLTKPGGQIIELGTSAKESATTSLLVSDLVPRLTQARALVERLDVEVPSPAITEYQPKFLSASALTTLATQIAAKQEAVQGAKLRGEIIASPSGNNVLIISRTPQAWLDLLSQLDAREPISTTTYAVSRFAAEDVAKLIEDSIATDSDDRWKLVIDSITGSLIVTATPTQHEAIAALIERLKQVEDVATPMRAFEIRYRPVADVAATLTNLIEAGMLDAPPTGAARDDITSGASQRTPPSATIVPPQSAAPAATDSAPHEHHNTNRAASELRLTADEATNTLIAVGEPRRLSRLEELIRLIDVRQPQVMLDVMLVSMNDSDSLSLGVELERLGKVDNAATRIASLFGLSTGGTSARTTGDSPGFTGSVLNPGEFSIIVKALQSLNKGNSLSNPRVLVANNEQAVFSSTLQQPVQTQTRTGSNDTTFSYGGSESAGTTISVKPQIAQGDHLLLTYSIKLSSFVGTPTTAGLPPPKQENSVDSVAAIPDGHTVVVGGLELRSDSNGESRIPGLGAIPLIGNLFKNQSRAGSRTRFFVFIRPSVLRHQGFDDLKYMSQTAAESAQINDGFPEVSPQIIR